MVCLSRPYHFKYFKCCLPEVLLGPFLNNLTHLIQIHHVQNYDFIEFILVDEEFKAPPRNN